ncbi:YggS family pyridoxal phosphate-dependent enzyme [Limosilactobacillus reuteri]|uniref:YggS family pyridoxal phosphate-dependent enzyme n=1 Tax=Limosilactobacillus reuteri TaxID=1598 RepID=UPI001E40C8CF|nr:YggS family pyridoxal phosphate-dependent enzyme [Limosilactobacillus reuteri]MCC4327270.1 YggS family pyridoxal phosphate-dependent enzyme [Limosilactobacillus reuteri]MCC4336291.1 YggS family pyridoxal phosphate-dependent enzyme [Limosilactobacillus reuteri]MCC4338838.1 YggS family pyridoxal phosphate-dependent enzyme [Limosilactobacillus reuteri]
MTIVDKAKEVQEKIIAACKRSGRDPQEVQLLPVSKNHPAADIAELYKVGWNDFGENYVQELDKKHDELPADINWYMIGHLQRNKVKYIADYVTMIQSVDSLKLMNTIEKEGRKHDRIIPILIEVNVGEEESKFGVKPTLQDCMELAEASLQLPHVKLRGLMTSAPYYDDPEKTRPIFRRLRELRDEMNNQNDQLKLDVLSMGMTHDYEIAVEEGSTCVRVGTAIFGPRDYSNRQY